MTRTSRRQPRQARSLATREAIFEATAQILELEGEAGFNTNRIAERAGVSVGTLYQYFADKRAILAEMARQENERVRREITAGLADGEIEPARLAIRIQLAIWADRPATRRAALAAIMAEERVEGVAREMRQTGRLLPQPAERIDAFVLSRAINGVIRAAVLEGSPFLADPRLEGSLMRLVEGYGARWMGSTQATD